MASLTSLGRIDLDGNKLAKGICLKRKARDKEVFYRGSPIFLFEFLSQC